MVATGSLVATQGPEAKSRHQADSGGVSGVSEEDTVSLSGAAAGTRSERVDALRRQYQDGSYQVDAQEVSGRMIDRHLEP